MTKVFTIAHLPDDLAQSWLQHLRDFDTAHPGCHFEVAAEAPNATLAEVVRTLQINPTLDFTAIYERKKESWRWIGCGECDVSFACDKGRARCIRWGIGHT